MSAEGFKPRFSTRYLVVDTNEGEFQFLLVLLGLGLLREAGVVRDQHVVHAILAGWIQPSLRDEILKIKIC